MNPLSFPEDFGIHTIEGNLGTLHKAITLARSTPLKIEAAHRVKFTASCITFRLCESSRWVLTSPKTRINNKEVWDREWAYFAHRIFAASIH